MNSLFKKMLLVAMALLAIMLPELAMAQDLFAPPEGDKSREWFIRGLFGTLDGGGDDPLISIVGVFNSAVMLVGGILLFYTLVGGTVRTAGEGKVLGRWDSVWLPIRTVLGVAAIMPINGGYALIQYAVIWLAVQGIGIAGNMSDRFLEAAMGEQNQYTYDATTIKPEIADVVKQMILNAACVASFDSNIQNNADYTKKVFGISEPLPSILRDPKPTSPIGTHDFYAYRYGCGFISFPSQDMGGEVRDLKLINTEALATLRRNMWQAHLKQRDIALAESAKVGFKVIQYAIESGDEEAAAQYVNTEVERIASAWAQAVTQVAKSQSLQLVNHDLVEAISKDGWIMLGSWYMQIALSQQTISEAMSVLPDVSTPDAIIEGAQANQEGRNAFGRVVAGFVRFAQGEKVMIGEAAPLITFAAKAVGVGDGTAFEAGSSASRGMFSSITRRATAVFTGIDVKGSDKNPVVMATEIGGRLMVSSTIAITFFAVIAGAAGASATIGTNLVLVAVSILSPMLVTMLGAGLTLSYYIPMIPYILWLGAVFGWVILIVEAVIAAPLWAVTHLAPDGDGVVGRGGQGYMLVLSLTLRPALMVFGFAAAVAVMDPMGKFVNETFAGAFFGSVSSGMTGLLKILAGAVIYMTVMLMIINRVFSLIHQIPDGILRWMGGGDNVIGREAEQASSGAGKAIAAGTAAAGAVGAMQGAGREIGNMARERRIADRNNRNAAAGTAAQLAGNAEDKASRALSNADRGASNLDPASPTFEQEEAGVRQQADAAATGSVYSIGRAAEATLASARATKPGDAGRPSDADIEAAQQIVDSIKKSRDPVTGASAETDPAKARAWLASNSSKFSNSKFGSQITAATGGVSAVDAKLAGARQGYLQHRSDAAKSQALGSVGDIHASANDIIQRAGEALPGDPNAPTQDQVSDAMSIRDSIEKSGALESGDAAQSWLKNEAGRFSSSTMGEDILQAVKRASGSGGGQNEKGVNG